MWELSQGMSKAFQEVLLQTDAYAKSVWPVLILGETGVGKELFAHRLHDRSPRKHESFIPVNCSALPANLFESELFGYEKGAFSGAINSSRGLVRMANGGTLFLDEIGDLDLNLQAKLLRLLEQGEVRSVGSTKIEKVNVRIITATNVNLHQAVREKKFRLDLLERLSILNLRIPSLRERKEDIPIIAQDIVDRLGATLDPAATVILKHFTWEGNVRQMRNTLIRTSILGKNKIDAPTLKKTLSEIEAQQISFSTPTEKASFMSGTLADIEREIIIQRLKKNRGNRKKTADELGMAKSTLHEKLKAWKQEAFEDETPVAWPILSWPDLANQAPSCDSA